MTSNYCNIFKVLQSNITRYYSSTVQQPPLLPGATVGIVKVLQKLLQNF